MKKILAMAGGVFLPVVLIATVNAGQGNGTATGQTGTSVQPAPKKAVGSRRQKAQQEIGQARIERNAMQSGASGTASKKARLSRRNKAMLEQKEQAKGRRAAIKSEASTTGEVGQ